MAAMAASPSDEAESSVGALASAVAWASTGVSPISSATSAEGCHGTEASKEGGSGRFWAMPAILVGSCSATSCSKKRSISSSNPATRLWTRSISYSIWPACSSSSRSRPCLRSAILPWVSSRIRAISAFDQSWIPEMSSSDRLRSSVASTAEREWISSMNVLASVWNWLRVWARDSSAAACIARVRSSTNFVGGFAAGRARRAGRRGRCGKGRLHGGFLRARI